MHLLLERHYIDLVQVFSYEESFSYVNNIEDLIAIAEHFAIFARNHQQYHPAAVTAREQTLEYFKSQTEKVLALFANAANLNKLEAHFNFTFYEPILKAHGLAIVSKLGLAGFIELNSHARWNFLSSTQNNVLQFLIDQATNFSELMAIKGDSCNYDKEIQISERSYQLFLAMPYTERFAAIAQDSKIADLFTPSDLKKLSVFFPNEKLAELAQASEYFAWRVIKANLPEQRPSQSVLAKLSVLNPAIEAKIERRVKKIEAKAERDSWGYF
jgi:hypothetical protein